MLHEKLENKKDKLTKSRHHGNNNIRMEINMYKCFNTCNSITPQWWVIAHEQNKRGANINKKREALENLGFHHKGTLKFVVSFLQTPNTQNTIFVGVVIIKWANKNKGLNHKWALFEHFDFFIKRIFWIYWDNFYWKLSQ
jgi:hypothetical protein